MRTKQEIEAELKESERDKAIARFCEVIADYGLPIPTDIQKEFDSALGASTNSPSLSDTSRQSG
jgi:hypothetical protein